MAEIVTNGAGVFTPGQENIDAPQLNAIIANATIQTVFYSGKGAASANPAKAGHSILLLDTTGPTPTYKIATLAAAIFDNSEFIQARAAKATPVAADTVMIGDSAASGTPKQATVAAILFGAGAHALPIAADKIPIFDSTGGLIGTITLANLIHLLVAHTAPVAADEIMVRESGGAVRSMTLLSLLNGMVAETAPLGTMKVPVTDGVTVKNVTLATLISGIAASLTTAAGTELIQVNDGGALKKMLLSDLRHYATTPYLVYAEEQASGTNGGTNAAGSWNARTLNVEKVDTASIGSLAANQITLPAGTYRCRIRCPAYDVGTHQARLWNVTDAALILQGSPSYCDNSQTDSDIIGRFTLAGTKTIQVEQKFQASLVNFGLGLASGYGTETYTVAEFWLE